MAKQLIPQALRNALWATYDHRCFYCRGNVAYDLLEIDHIIPEGLRSTATFTQQLHSYGLDADWDVSAVYNLVPSCPSCNARKSARLPNPKQMILFLTQARDNAPKVEAARVKLLERIRRENLLAQLAIALETGRMTNSDVTAVIRQPSEDLQSAALIAIETYFVGVSLSELRPENVEQLFDCTVRLGGNTFTGLTLVTSEGEQVNVETARQYQKAIARGCFAATTFAMKMECFFRDALGLLNALAAKRPARKASCATHILEYVICNTYLRRCCLTSVIGKRLTLHD